MTSEIDIAMKNVEKWVGNPISRRMLKFVCKKDKCGNRLENAIDSYTGLIDKEKKLCWKCKIAGMMVSFVINRGISSFGANKEEVKRRFREPVFKRGLMNVLEGIAAYGVTKPQIVNAPFLVVWDFTKLCNLKCKHCYENAGEKMKDELTTEEAKKLIDEMADAGVVAIAFSGGEPLTRKDFFEVAKYAKDKGMYVSIATNGTLITKDIAKYLKYVVDYVEISLDGKDAKTHNAFRGIPVFDKVIEGIKNSVAAGLYTCVATTVTKYNYDQIEDIYTLVKNLGVKRFICFNFIPTGKGVEIIDYDISPEEREKLLNFLFDKLEGDCAMKALSTAPQFARIAVEREKGVPVGHFYGGAGLEGRARALADFIGGCGAGRIYCSIEPNGDVQPCVFMPIKVGNVRKERFLDIWHNSPTLKTLRDRSLLKGHCANCENKFICGGCRARAYAYFNDITAPDPGCINNKDYWEKLKKKEKAEIV